MDQHYQRQGTATARALERLRAKRNALEQAAVSTANGQQQQQQSNQAAILGANSAASQRNARLKYQAKKLLDQLQTSDTSLVQASDGFKLLFAKEALKAVAERQAMAVDEAKARKEQQQVQQLLHQQIEREQQEVQQRAASAAAAAAEAAAAAAAARADRDVRAHERRTPNSSSSRRTASRMAARDRDNDVDAWRDASGDDTSSESSMQPPARSKGSRGHSTKDALLTVLLGVLQMQQQQQLQRDKEQHKEQEQQHRAPPSPPAPDRQASPPPLPTVVVAAAQPQPMVQQHVLLPDGSVGIVQSVLRPVSATAQQQQPIVFTAPGQAPQVLLPQAATAVPLMVPSAGMHGMHAFASPADGGYGVALPMAGLSAHGGLASAGGMMPMHHHLAAAAPHMMGGMGMGMAMQPPYGPPYNHMPYPYGSPYPHMPAHHHLYMGGHPPPYPYPYPYPYPSPMDAAAAQQMQQQQQGPGAGQGPGSAGGQQQPAPGPGPGAYSTRYSGQAPQAPPPSPQQYPQAQPSGESSDTFGPSSQSPKQPQPSMQQQAPASPQQQSVQQQQHPQPAGMRSSLGGAERSSFDVSNASTASSLSLGQPGQGSPSALSPGSLFGGPGASMQDKSHTRYTAPRLHEISANLRDSMATVDSPASFRDMIHGHGRSTLDDDASPAPSPAERMGAVLTAAQFASRLRAVSSAQHGPSSLGGDPGDPDGITSGASSMSLAHGSLPSISGPVAAASAAAAAASAIVGSSAGLQHAGYSSAAASAVAAAYRSPFSELRHGSGSAASLDGLAAASRVSSASAFSSSPLRQGSVADLAQQQLQRRQQQLGLSGSLLAGSRQDSLAAAPGGLGRADSASLSLVKGILAVGEGSGSGNVQGGGGAAAAPSAASAAAAGTAASSASGWPTRSAFAAGYDLGMRTGSYSSVSSARTASAALAGASSAPAPALSEEASLGSPLVSRGTGQERDSPAGSLYSRLKPPPLLVPEVSGGSSMRQGSGALPDSGSKAAADGSVHGAVAPPRASGGQEEGAADAYSPRTRMVLLANEELRGSVLTRSTSRGDSSRATSDTGMAMSPTDHGPPQQQAPAVGAHHAPSRLGLGPGQRQSSFNQQQLQPADQPGSASSSSASRNASLTGIPGAPTLPAAGSDPPAAPAHIGAAAAPPAQDLEAPLPGSFGSLLVPLGGAAPARASSAPATAPASSGPPASAPSLTLEPSGSLARGDSFVRIGSVLKMSPTTASSGSLTAAGHGAQLPPAAAAAAEPPRAGPSASSSKGPPVLGGSLGKAPVTAGSLAAAGPGAGAGGGLPPLMKAASTRSPPTATSGKALLAVSGVGSKSVRISGAAPAPRTGAAKATAIVNKVLGQGASLEFESDDDEDSASNLTLMPGSGRSSAPGAVRGASVSGEGLESSAVEDEFNF